MLNLAQFYFIWGCVQGVRLPEKDVFQDQQSSSSFGAAENIFSWHAFFWTSKRTIKKKDRREEKHYFYAVD